MNKETILKKLKSRRGRGLRPKELGRSLGIRERQYPDFRRQLNEMVRAGAIIRASDGRLTVKGPPTVKDVATVKGSPAGAVQGLMELTHRGFGFVTVEGMDDVFVEGRDVHGAASGDLVLLDLRRQKFGKGPKGRVTRILKRGRSTLVGTAVAVPGGMELVLSQPFANRAVRLATDGGIVPLAGMLVVARVTDWGEGEAPIRAEVEEVIGSPDDPLTDFKFVLRQFDLDPQFSPQLEAEVARHAKSVTIGPGNGRTDIRSHRVVTIDPESARDFDDAISLERRDGEFWELGVHIADVSMFVPSGGALDREALARGNSVYFTEGVVPMLPHLLSSELCSLKPDEDRLTVSAFITLDGTAQVSKVRFARTLIRSKRRFTYGEVHDILANGSGKWYKFFRSLKDVTDQLYKRRVEQGSVDFDIPEPLFDLDQNGVPHFVHPSQRLDSHRMVEESMLLANRVVAERIPDGKSKRPFIYRVHDEPGKEQVEKLSALLKRLNLPGLPRGEVTSKEVRDLLLAVEDSPYRDLIESITLRSMAKAIYLASNRGHFGLAFRSYTHFTSPIRRYADLIVHRLMVEQLTRPDKPWSISRANLDKIAQQCSERERAALEAERAYSRLKELRFLATQIDKEFDGIISGVIPKGIFVQIREFLVDGFVSVDWLEGDEYVFDEGLFALRGKRMNELLQLGQEVRIRVRDVSIEKRFANFLLVEAS
ncbi:MAG: ribonuclease R [Candidatus Marinimicrobia bacterium]|nr:ribonuclease R [Candidatus Neomarinimicrobiota bacterium]